MLPALEQIDREGGESFSARSFTVSAFPFNWHVHPEFELTLIDAGRGQRFVGGAIDAIVPGEAVLLGPAVPHSWRGDPDGPACRASVIQFRPDVLGESLFALPEMGEVRALLDASVYGLATADAGLAARIRRLPERRSARRVPALLDALVEMTQATTRRLNASPANRGLRERQRRRIDRACRLLHARYLEPVPLDDVAEVLGVTPPAASRMFRRATGHTVTDYLHELRVAHACRALAESEAPITQVAFDAGFGNLAHFNRVFRRLRGRSPREFRRALRSDAR
ncbi:MAG: AraC family transcriptional regulator [Planctomycetota bacterium]